MRRPSGPHPRQDEVNRLFTGDEQLAPGYGAAVAAAAPFRRRRHTAAPFCKHLFVPNFVGAVGDTVQITDDNCHLLRSGYEVALPVAPCTPPR